MDRPFQFCSVYFECRTSKDQSLWASLKDGIKSYVVSTTLLLDVLQFKVDSALLKKQDAVSMDSIRSDMLISACTFFCFFYVSMLFLLLFEQDFTAEMEANEVRGKKNQISKLTFNDAEKKVSVLSIQCIYSMISLH